MPAGAPGRHAAAGPRHAVPQVPAPRDPSAGHRFGPSAPPPGYGVPGYGPQPYTPPLPPAPASRVPRWVLPATLVAVILGAGAAIGGISMAALAAGGETSTVAAGTGDRAFLTAVSTRPALAEVPPDTLIELGHGVCSSLEGGASRGDLVSAAVSAGFGTRDAQVLVDAARASYCPGA